MNKIRITSGTYRGRFIKTLPDLRPTSELVRKAIFDILGQSLDGKTFLDLFAGSGAVGFEAVSRNAPDVTFVDNISSHTKLIKDNATTLDVGDRITIHTLSVEDFLKHNKVKFDIVFADPWYESALDLSTWDIPSFLVEDGVLIVEHDKKHLPIPNDKLKILNQKSYGNTALTFFTQA